MEWDQNQSHLLPAHSLSAAQLLQSPLPAGVAAAPDLLLWLAAPLALPLACQAQSQHARLVPFDFCFDHCHCHGTLHTVRLKADLSASAQMHRLHCLMQSEVLLVGQHAEHLWQTELKSV